MTEQDKVLYRDNSQKCYNGPWKNRRSPLYTQYCNIDETPEKLLMVLLHHGSCFDDEWQYRIAGRSRIVVVRRPLWLDIIESGKFAEKG